MKGNTGKIINVNLSTAHIEEESLPEEYYKNYIGGSGLAAKLFWERGDFAADPLSSEAMLIFMNGPFAGLKLSGASRGSVAGCSPLTGHWGDSSCGGYFAPELRYAGYDGIIITGKSPIPVLMLIEDNNIRMVDASVYWSKGIDEVNRSLKEVYGKNARTMVIGPAGENLVKYSIVLNDGHHASGRAGFGAIMGSKNLKAIVVKASSKNMEFADSEKVDLLRSELNQRIREGLNANLLRENGTAANLVGGVYAGDVPVKNWTSCFWEEAAEELTGSILTEKYLTRRSACAFCGVACKRIIEIKDGPWAIPEGTGPEYETIVAFGTLIGSIDLAAACKAGRVCNDLGIDTISAGSTIAWAMEAFEKKALSVTDTGGIELKWGDLHTVIDILLPDIAYRNGKIGRILAEGSAAAARKIGKGSIDYTTHCKGLEAPMHDPRGGGHGLALTYAMSPRGACHVADPMLLVEMGSRYYPEIGFDYELEPQTSENKPEAAVISVELGALENSACFCQFCDGELSITEWVDLFNAVAGYGWDFQEMMRAGRRVFYLKRLINFQYGLTAADDDLTSRMLEPATDGAPEGIEIDLAGMRAKFYELMKIDAVKGIPSRDVLVEYGMSDEAAIIW